MKHQRNIPHHFQRSSSPRTSTGPFYQKSLQSSPAISRSLAVIIVNFLPFLSTLLVSALICLSVFCSASIGAAAAGERTGEANCFLTTDNSLLDLCTCSGPVKSTTSMKSRAGRKHCGNGELDRRFCYNLCESCRPNVSGLEDSDLAACGR